MHSPSEIDAEPVRSDLVSSAHRRFRTRGLRVPVDANDLVLERGGFVPKRTLQRYESMREYHGEDDDSFWGADQVPAPLPRIEGNVRDFHQRPLPERMPPSALICDHNRELFEPFTSPYTCEGVVMKVIMNPAINRQTRDENVHKIIKTDFIHAITTQSLVANFGESLRHSKATYDMLAVALLPVLDTLDFETQDKLESVLQVLKGRIILDQVRLERGARAMDFSVTTRERAYSILRNFQETPISGTRKVQLGSVWSEQKFSTLSMVNRLADACYSNKNVNLVRRQFGTKGGAKGQKRKFDAVRGGKGDFLPSKSRGPPRRKQQFPSKKKKRIQEPQK